MNTVRERIEKLTRKYETLYDELVDSTCEEVANKAELLALHDPKMKIHIWTAVYHRVQAYIDKHKENRP